MPSFDVVSELDMHELNNAVQNTVKEVAGRFDFRGTTAKVELNDKQIKLVAESDFQVDQLYEMLEKNLIKRAIDARCIERKDMTPSGKEMHQLVSLKEGLEQTLAKKMINLIKEAKLKVQASINGEKLRVTGKKKDDLQVAIQFLRAQELEMPVQFDNFRD